MTTHIAIPTEDSNGPASRICGHFGHAPYFAIVTISDGNLSAQRLVRNPHLEHHKPGQMPAFVASQGAQVILAGKMGQRALDTFRSIGITVALAEADTVDAAVRAYQAGLRSQVTPCVEHAHADTCANHDA